MFSSPGPRATPRRSMKPRESLISERTGGGREPLTPLAGRSAARLGRLPPSPTASSVADTLRTGTTLHAASSRQDELLDRVFWSRDERRAIASAGSLPREVAGVIKASDMIRTPVSGHVDLQTGFAFVTTSEGCLVWNWARRTQASPTCYPFPAPPLARVPGPVQTPVLVALHSPVNSTAEPGVIMVLPSGELRFWDHASSALSNVDRYQSLQLEIPEDDTAERIWKIEGDSYIVTTAASLAYRITFASTAGRLVPSAQPLTRSAGMFARATSTIFTSKDERAGVRAVANLGNSLFVLAGRTMLRWTLQHDTQKLVQETDLLDLIGSELFENRWSSGNVDLEINDLVAHQPEQLMALISFADRSAGPSGSANVVSSHAVVLLDLSARSNAYGLSRTITLAYQSPPDPRAIESARLVTSPDSSVAFVRLPTCVVLVSLTESTPYEEVIALKDPSRNAFIGTSSPPPLIGKRASSASLMLMPLSGGLLSVDLFTPPTPLGAQSHGVIETARIKSQIEQAVFFGDRSDNPLALDVYADSEGDVAAASEAVSAEILTSRSPYMASIYELRPQLVDRMQRLRGLFKCIRRNGLLSRVPQASRRRLSQDAEKAKAAVDLWDYQNRIMDQIHSGDSLSLLADSIRDLQQQLRSDGEDDFVRDFFRYQVEHLDRILELVFARLQAALASANRGTNYTSWISEATKMFIIVFKAAAKYREEELALYDIDREKPSTPLWTARSSLIDALESLYSSTERLIKDRTREYGSVVDEAPSGSSSAELRDQQVKQNLLKNQMRDLAAALCTNMEDRLRVASRRQLEDGADQQEGLALQLRWAQMKPNVIRPLVSIDRVDAAYDLAEHHSDFETLVWLCHDATASKGQARIQAYIERFGEEFAFVMYQWYIDNGQYHALLTQDEVYGALLTKFFDTTEPGSQARQRYPGLSWIHHIACKRYGQAASATSMLRSSTEVLEDKEFISSIGKLAEVADIQAAGASDKRRQRLIDFDAELDAISVQKALRSLLEASSPRNQKQSAKHMEQKATNLAGRPALMALFVQLVQKLLSGTALDTEGLVDVLSMRDGEDGQADAVTALQQLAKDRRLPEGRKQVALISTWRRVFIRDDWSMIANTSGRSEEAQRRLLRGTATYKALMAIERLDNFPRAFILAPFTSSQPPLTAELSARFPEKTSAEVEALLGDHEDEIRVLVSYIDSAGLEARVKEVAALVQADVAEEDDDDDDMSRDNDEDVQM